MKPIKCDTCNIEFTPSKKQQSEIQEAAQAGIERFIVECPNCHSLVFVFPLKILGIKDAVPDPIEDHRIFCCPVSACIGFVEKDIQSNVFGCSECGTEWKTLKLVYADIAKIIKKYSYRQKVYIKDGSKWRSIDLDKIPKGYYDKVQKEKV